MGKKPPESPSLTRTLENAIFEVAEEHRGNPRSTAASRETSFSEVRGKGGARISESRHKPRKPGF